MSDGIAFKVAKNWYPFYNLPKDQYKQVSEILFDGLKRLNTKLDQIVNDPSVSIISLDNYKIG